MQVKTFTGSSTQDVMAQVKAELGPDAIILASRELNGNGLRLFEITAGVERPAGSFGFSGTGPDAASAPPGWEEWHKEWSRIKEHLYALMQPCIPWEKLPPRHRMVLEYLQREGVENDVVLELYRALTESVAGTSMLAALAHLVPVQGFTEELWPQKLHFVAGPFGVGKTSAALRLGLALRHARPDISVAYLNADCTRGNGRLVLRHWAELSDFGYYETPDAATMLAGINACRNYDVVFVDLPGLGREETLRDRMCLMGLSAWLDGGKAPCSAALHLVMPPHYGDQQIASFLRRYQVSLPGSLIWSKLDEALSFGTLVNVAVGSGLPISAVSFGPELQSSLLPAEESIIWRLLLKRQLPGSAHSGGAASPL